MMGKLIFLSEKSASSEAHGEVSVHSTDIIYFEGMTDVGKKKKLKLKWAGLIKYSQERF